ncbi:DUF2218 domain-containing protein [Halioxenophilus sp. WMMB6]|uniref:DUF2218 domain-containing protein n=1 Tax=Halioxenophilus sp. WMMB6 TaxID=3073815 RepID=UPI00295F401A|nr:DUF2218 domain-containing protein [Halioxenophilus sp. WMMB6]
MQTQANVKTASGELYMKKLCRHFAHKVPATVNGAQGLIEFPFGRCRLDATGEQLHLAIDLTDSELVERAEQVVGSHLLRMAPKEALEVNWQRTEH